MKRVKYLTIVLCLIAMASLTGAKKKSVELLNKSLLIDLDKAIKKVDFGAGGNQSQKEKNKTEQSTENNSISANTAESDKRDEEKTDTSDSDSDSTSIVISVRDTTIKMDGKTVSNVDDIKTTIVEKYPNGISISLVDDYAKASTFREIIEVMKQLKDSGKYDYSIN